MLRQTMAGGNRGQAQHHRQSDVCQSPAPHAGTYQFEGLETEGGECSETAADPHHDKEANVIGDWVFAAVQRERAEVADDEGANHVDENGADGKANTDIEGEHQPADRVAQDPTQCTADRNPEIRHRLPRSSSLLEEVKLAEVISRVIQAVLGDLIPVTQSYNMANALL
jgi:hypothetical protein